MGALAFRISGLVAVVLWLGSVSAAGAASMHAVLAIESLDPTVGRSAEVDRMLMQRELRGAATAAGLDYIETVIDGYALNAENVLAAIARMQVGSDDVVVFYYSGHGGRKRDRTSRFPLLDIRYANGSLLDVDTAKDAVVRNSPRLAVVISDACNSVIGESSSRSRPIAPAAVGARRLWRDWRGLVQMTAATPGEFAWGNDSGGKFTLALIEAMHDVSAIEDANWDLLGSQATRPLIGIDRGGRRVTQTPYAEVRLVQSTQPTVGGLPANPAPPPAPIQVLPSIQTASEPAEPEPADIGLSAKEQAIANIIRDTEDPVVLRKLLSKYKNGPLVPILHQRLRQVDRH